MSRFERKSDEIVRLHCGCAIYTDLDGKERTSYCEEHKKTYDAPSTDFLILQDIDKWFEQHSTLTVRNYKHIVRNRKHG